METTDTLQQAIDYARQGNATTASRLLARYVIQQPKSDTAWLWLAACLDDPEKQEYCLKKAGEIDSNNPSSIDELANYISDRLVKPSRRRAAPKPESIPLPAPNVAVASPADAHPPMEPVQKGFSSTQMTILIVLAIAVVVVLAALGYVVLFADPNFLPNLFQSIVGG